MKTFNARSGMWGLLLSLLGSPLAGNLSAQTNGPLNEALDAPSLIWSATGTVPWIAQNAVTHDGVDAAQSGSISDSASSGVRTTVVGPGTVSFWWKVSCETNSDSLRFYIAGAEQMRISGEVDWQQRTIAVPSGSQNLEWKYFKSPSGAAGQDRAWLDDVQFQPCGFALSASNATHDFGSSTGVVSVTASTNCNWVALSTNAWITILSGANGVGDGTVPYQVSPNASHASRVGYLRIANLWFSVTQSGDPSPCTFVITSTNSTHGPGTSTGLVSVIAAEGCPWTSVNTNPWVTLLFGSNTGSAHVTYSLAPNFTGAPRSGNLLIAGQLFTVNQAASSPVFVISTSAIDVGPENWATSPIPWTGQTNVTHDGVDAAQSGPVSDGQSSYFALVYIRGPATVSFWWKVSSDADNDVLRFSLNQVEQARISGEVDWQQRTFTIPAGEFNELTWEYSKNGSVSAGQDRGWLDQVQITGSSSCNFSILPSSRSHQSGATNGVVNVTNAFPMCPWWVLNTNSWIQISSTPYGFGNGSVAYEVAENPNPGPRSGYLVFEDRAFQIIQSGYLTCTYSLSATTRSYGGGVTNDVVDVSASSPLCPWTASTTNAWITILSGLTGSGTGTVSYALSANPDPQPRIGSIIVEGRTLKIVQAVDPSILTQPASQTIPPGGTAVLSVTAAGTSPLGYQWQFNGASLVDGDDVSGATTPTLTIANALESQTGGYRVIVSNSNRAATSSVATLTVTCGFALFPRSASYSSISNSGFINVSAAAGCPWIVVNTNPWVTLLSSETNAGYGTVLYSVAENPTTDTRSGTIQIAGLTFSLSQLGSSPTNPIPLAEALDTVGELPWGTTGTPVWFGQSSVSHDGVDAAQSGPVGHGAAVTVQTTVTGPGAISFWWKVSSEQNADFLKFFINGVQQIRISGEVDWQLRSLPITSTTNILKWTYSKDSSVSAALDRGWVDQVRFIPGASCVVSLSQTNAAHSWNSETGEVNVAAACTWTVNNTNAWITPLVDVGDGNGAFRYAVAANNSPFARSGKLTIGGQSFTISQQAGTNPCAATISPAIRYHDYPSAVGVISIYAPYGCSWNVVNTNAWISIVAGANGSGFGQVEYSISDNTTSSPERTGVITVGGQSFTVVQAYGAPPCPSLLSPGSRALDHFPTTESFNITSPSNCTWIIHNTNDWIFIPEITSTGSGYVNYSVAENTNHAARSGNIRVGDQLFFVTQAGGISLGEAMDLAGISIEHYGRTGGSFWEGQSAVTHDGEDAAQSGSPGSDFGTTAYVPGTLTFWWKASGSTNGGVHFYIDHVEQAAITNEVDWQQRTFTIPAGRHSLDWNYLDSTPGGGSGHGWVDQVQFTPAPGCAVGLMSSGTSYMSSGTSTGQFNVVTAGNCSWSASNTNPWITIVSGGSGSGSGGANYTITTTLTYTVAPNNTAFPRTGYIQIADQAYSITQSGNPNAPGNTNAPTNCVVSISPTNRAHGYSGGTNFVYVVTQTGCPWNVVKTNSWINLRSGTNGSGSGMVVYFLSPNTTDQTRSGTITIGGRQFVVTQLGTFDTNAPRVQITSQTKTNAMLSVKGEQGKLYVLEWSDDLIQWAPITTNAAQSVSDIPVGPTQRRFYRTVELP